MEGYINLHRALLDSKVFANETALKIWIWCLLKANFKKKHLSLKIGKGEIVITVERGQFIFGRFKAESELNIVGSTVYKWMKKFEDDGMILIKSNNQYSVITICNYETYQYSEISGVTTKEQPKHNLSTTKAQPKHTTNKDNKDNKDNKNNIDSLNYPFSSEKFMNLWDKLKNTKKWMKKENGSLQMSLNKLGKFDEEFAIELIESAIEGEYQGVVFQNTNIAYKKWKEEKDGTGREANTTGNERKRKLLEEADEISRRGKTA